MNYAPKIIKEIATSTTVLQLSEDGIVISKININGSRETGEHIAKEILKATTDLCGSNTYPMLVQLTCKRKLDSKERQYYKNNSIGSISKVAMIVRTPYEQMLGNFFIGVNKFKPTCKLFSNELKAVSWLLKEDK